MPFCAPHDVEEWARNKSDSFHCSGLLKKTYRTGEFTKKKQHCTTLQMVKFASALPSSTAMRLLVPIGICPRMNYHKIHRVLSLLKNFISIYFRFMVDKGSLLGLYKRASYGKKKCSYVARGEERCQASLYQRNARASRVAQQISCLTQTGIMTHLVHGA